MSEDPDRISARENHRAERGGDPGGRATDRRRGGDPGGTSRGENTKGVSSRENQRGEAAVVNAMGDRPRENQRGKATVVAWEELLARAGCDPGVIAHAKAVTAVALSYTGSPLVNRDLVQAGAMLHDLGRCRTHGISHAREGAALARSLGLDPAVAAIIGRHIGAGLTADECSLLRLLPVDCIPFTIEEKIVANADNLVFGRGEGSIVRTLGSALSLRKRIRRRIYRLYLEMEAFRS